MNGRRQVGGYMYGVVSEFRIRVVSIDLLGFFSRLSYLTVGFGDYLTDVAFGAVTVGHYEDCRCSFVGVRLSYVRSSVFNGHCRLTTAQSQPPTLPSSKHAPRPVYATPSASPTQPPAQALATYSSSSPPQHHLSMSLLARAQAWPAQTCSSCTLHRTETTSPSRLDSGRATICHCTIHPRTSRSWKVQV